MIFVQARLCFSSDEDNLQKSEREVGYNPTCAYWWAAIEHDKRLRFSWAEAIVLYMNIRLSGWIFWSILSLRARQQCIRKTFPSSRLFCPRGIGHVDGIQISRNDSNVFNIKCIRDAGTTADILSTFIQFRPPSSGVCYWITRGSASVCSDHHRMGLNAQSYKWIGWMDRNLWMLVC